MKNFKTFWKIHRMGVLVLAVLSVLLIAVEGCKGYDAKEAYEKKKKAEDRTSVGCFRRVEFEGHDYILYKENAGPSRTFSGVTHDPDCECFLDKD